MPTSPTPVIVFPSIVTSTAPTTEMPFRFAPRIRLFRMVTLPAWPRPPLRPVTVMASVGTPSTSRCASVTFVPATTTP